MHYPAIGKAPSHQVLAASSVLSAEVKSTFIYLKLAPATLQNTQAFPSHIDHGCQNPAIAFWPAPFAFLQHCRGPGEVR